MHVRRFFYLFSVDRGRVGLHGHRGPQPRSLGAVPDHGLRQCGGAVRAAGRRVPGDDPGRGLRRRGRGPVPVRGDDARRRFRRAAAGLPAIPAGRRADRRDLADRAACSSSAPGRSAAVSTLRPRAAGRRGRRDQHRGDRAGALHAVRLLLPGRRPGAAGGHDRRHRADAAPKAGHQTAGHRAAGPRTQETAVEVRKVPFREGV